MPTAYLSPSQLKELTDVSVSPALSQNGYPLTWNNTLGKWVATPLQISSLTGGPLPLTLGGLGVNVQSAPDTARSNLGLGTLAIQNSNALSVTGSIFTDHSPELVSASSFGWISTSTQSGAGGGAQNVFRRANGASGGSAQNVQAGQNLGAFSFRGWLDSNYTGSRAFMVCTATENWSTTSTPTNLIFFVTPSGLAAQIPRMTLQSSGQLSLSANIAATSTTTGTLAVSGGVGATGAIYNGGNLVSGGAKINFANLPTTDTGLAAGDLWRDGNTVKVKT